MVRSHFENYIGWNKEYVNYIFCFFLTSFKKCNILVRFYSALMAVIYILIVYILV